MNINVENQEGILQQNDILSLKNIKEKTSKKDIYINIKRVLDILISSIALIILSPIFFVIAILIKIDSKGPVFFKHTRIGKNGQLMKMYKFRTMYNNAEDMIKEFTPEQMKEWKENYKLTNDPRITKMGKFLRKTSLDELPQLINILKGDLSLIGPRPVIEEELEKYEDNKEKFLSIKPGLTGYWAANGRSNTSYEERMEMELFYIDNLSFQLDFKVFFKTIEAVVKRKGAV